MIRIKLTELATETNIMSKLSPDQYDISTGT